MNIIKFTASGKDKLYFESVCPVFYQTFHEAYDVYIKDLRRLRAMHNSLGYRDVEIGYGVAYIEGSNIMYFIFSGTAPDFIRII